MKYVACEIAFAHVQLPDGKLLCRQIVTFDAEGRPVSFRKLQLEEPFVEWHDETYCFTS